MGGGAWPFLVGGVICLVDSVNERDPDLFISASVLVIAITNSHSFGSTAERDFWCVAKGSSGR